MTTKKRVSAVSANVTAALDGEKVLHLEFLNGSYLSIAPSQLTPEIREIALLHGLKQKLVDAAAMSRNPITGRSATIEDKFEAVSIVHKRLLAGAWNAPREGSGATGGILFQALCRLYEGRKTPDELREYLAGKSDTEKTALRKNSRIAAVIEEIRAETGKDSGIDTDELLGELDNE
jgi:hypothetical protein